MIACRVILLGKSKQKTDVNPFLGSQLDLVFTRKFNNFYCLKVYFNTITCRTYSAFICAYKVLIFKILTLNYDDGDNLVFELIVTNSIVVNTMH